MRPAPVLIRVPKPDEKHSENRSPEGARRANRKMVFGVVGFLAFLWVPLGLIVALRLWSGKGLTSPGGANLLDVLLPIPAALTVLAGIGGVFFWLISRRRRPAGPGPKKDNPPPLRNGWEAVRGALGLVGVLLVFYVVLVLVLYPIMHILGSLPWRWALLGLRPWQAALLAPFLFVAYCVAYPWLKRRFTGPSGATTDDKTASAIEAEPPETPASGETLPTSHAPDGVGVELARLWDIKDRPPKLAEVESILRGPRPADAAQVVCLSQVPVPEVGELHFEPEIIAPTRRVPDGLPVVAIGLVGAIGWWALWRLGIITVAPRGLAGLFLLAFGIPSVAIWLWYAAVCPTYVRLAPGIVQILRYRWLGASRPTIRSYPMLPGTIAVVRKRGMEGKSILLEISRLGQSDRISFADVSDAEHATERMWQALLSTAPIPDLPDDRLIG